PWLLAPSCPPTTHAADGLLGGLPRSPESWRGGAPCLMDVGWSPEGRAVRRVHAGVQTTEEGTRGPGTWSLWTKPASLLWLVGSDDGSVARSCAYPECRGAQESPVGLCFCLLCTPGEPQAVGCQATA